jgi:hypothetical protein
VLLRLVGAELQGWLVLAALCWLCLRGHTTSTAVRTCRHCCADSVGGHAVLHVLNCAKN